MAESLPDWAERWDGRRRCRKCKARLVIVYDYTNTKHSACSASGWDEDKCPEPQPEEQEEL